MEDALPEDRLRTLIGAVDRVDGEDGRHNLGPHHQLLLEGLIEHDPAFVDLVDWPRTFPKVWGVLGWNLYVYHSHLGVNPPVAPDQPRVKQSLHWHQDSGRVNADIETHPRPRLSLKVAYFLTDMREPGQGNFSIIPKVTCKMRLSDPPTASATRPVPCRFAWRRGRPSSLTGACGIRQAPTGRPAHGRCCSTATPTAGSGPWSRPPSRRRSSKRADKFGDSFWARRPGASTATTSREMRTCAPSVAPRAPAR